MRFFYDTEFIEDGRHIDLVSIGVVAEDGREFYAVSTDFDASRASTWVRTHVLDKLPTEGHAAWASCSEIRAALYDFLTSADSSMPQLWAWVGAYDHVVLAQLWGDMSGLPREIPHYTCDIKQLWEFAGRPPMPHAPKGVHDALVDARLGAQRFRACARILGLDKTNKVTSLP